MATLEASSVSAEQQHTALLFSISLEGIRNNSNVIRKFEVFVRALLLL